MKYLLTVSYDGFNYSGWQAQKGKTTIEQVLASTIHAITKQDVQLVASGRTDASVSALGQTVHFEVNDSLNKIKFLSRLNHLLPSDIKALSIELVPQDFHARYSVKLKTYAYSFYLSQISVPYLDRVATQFKQHVDINVFEKQLKKIIGTHDFSSFCTSGSSVTGKTRTITNASLVKNGDLYTVTITGTGFLYNMVRIIIGTLINISCGKIKTDILNIIEQKDRTKSGFTASPNGLVLVSVEY